MSLKVLFQIKLESLELIKIITTILLVISIISISIFLFKNKDLVKDSKRNSLLEIYRFLASIFIIGYHAYLYNISDKNIFGDCNVYLYFFFIMSGFYMSKNIEKYKDQSLFKSLTSFLKDRLAAMGIPLLIAYIFTLSTSIIQIDERHMIYLILLWYINIMLIVECLYLIMFKLFKEKTIKIISLCLVIVACILKELTFLNVINISFLSPYHEINAFLYIPLGYLIYKQDIKVNINKILSIILSITCFLIPLILKIAAYEIVDTRIISLMSFIVLPIAFIFAKDIKFNNKYINILGKASFYIYIYQMIPRLLETLFYVDEYANYYIDNRIISSNIIFSLTILTILFTLFKNKKNIY